MRLALALCSAILGLASSSHALNILLNNDDGFGSANLRETYRLLREAGHNGLSNMPFYAVEYSVDSVYQPRSLDCGTRNEAERPRWAIGL